MAGPGGTEVNRISIRVVPDTDGFRKELKRQLKTALAGFEAKVEVTADLSAIKGKIKTEIQEAVRGAAEKVKIDVEVNVKNGEAAQAGKQIERAANAANPQVDVGVNTARFWREFEALLEKAKGRSIDVDINIHKNVFTTRFTQEFKRVEREMYSFERRYRETMTRSMRESSRFADGASRDGTRISDSFNNSVTNIRRGWLTFKRLLLLVAALAAPALGLVAGLLASIPSLAAAGGLAIGAIALGLDGIKGAAKELEPQLNELKSAVSGVFKQRLDNQFQQLKDSGIFKDLTTQFRYVANGLMDMSQGFFDVVTSGRGMEQINTIMGGTAKLFSDLKPFVADMTQSFLTLAESGAENFGKLSGSLKKWGHDFQQMTERLYESGTLDRMFTGLSSTFDGLMLGFDRLFEAGANAMGTLGKPIGEFLASIGTFFQKAEPAFSAFSALILNVGAQLLESLGGIFEKLSPGFIRLMDFLESFLVPLIQIIGNTLEPIASMISDVLIAGLDMLEPKMPAITAAFSELGTAISDALANPEVQAALMQFVAMLPSLAEALIQVIGLFADMVTYIAPIVPVLLNLVAFIVGPAITAFNLLLSAVEIVWNAIKLIVSTAVDGMITSVKIGLALLSGDWSGAWELLKGFAGRALERVVDFFRDFFTSVLGIFGKLKDGIKSWGSNLAALLKSLGLQAITNFINGIAEKLGPLKGLLNKISSMVSSALGGLGSNGSDDGSTTSAGKKVAETFSKDLQQGLENRKDWAYEGGYSMGESAGQGVADGLKDKEDEVAKMRAQIEAAAGLLDTTYSSMLGSGKKDQDPLKIYDEKAKKLRQTIQDLAIDMQVLLATGDQGDPDQFLKDMAKISSQATAAQNQLNALEGMMDSIYQGRKANDPFRDVTNLLDIGKTDWNQLLTQLGLAPSGIKSVSATAGQNFSDGFTAGFGTVEDKFKAMINRFGESQGVEDIVGKWDKILEESKLNTIGKDFLNEQKDEFMGDLGFGSGNGFIGKALENVPKIVYNVSSVDEVNTNERLRNSRLKYQYTGV